MSGASVGKLIGGTVAGTGAVSWEYVAVKVALRGGALHVALAGGAVIAGLVCACFWVLLMSEGRS